MTSTSEASGRTVQVGLVVTVAILAWIVTGDRMQGMDAGPGTDLGGLGWFVGVWVVMMAAMMFPSVLPAALTVNRRTTVFLGGYLATWTAAGVLAYAVFEALRPLDLGWEEGGRYVAAGVLLAAALYQVTPLKQACLTECRVPRISPWRPLQAGIAHGAWCVGCCWALMAALFALGVMSIAWMALIAAFIAADKLLPWKTVATGGVMAVLLVLAIAVAVSPENVPGLTLPERMPAMQAM